MQNELIPPPKLPKGLEPARARSAARYAAMGRGDNMAAKKIDSCVHVQESVCVCCCCRLITGAFLFLCSRRTKATPFVGAAGAAGTAAAAAAAAAGFKAVLKAGFKAVAAAAAGFKAWAANSRKSPENIQSLKSPGSTNFHRWKLEELHAETAVGVSWAAGGTQLPAAQQPVLETPDRSHYASSDRYQQVRLVGCRYKRALHAVDQVWTLALGVLRTCPDKIGSTTFIKIKTPRAEALST